MADARFLIRGAPGLRLLAQRQMPGEAELAVPAEDGKAGDHMIAGLHVVNVRPDGLHDAGAFVTQNHGQLTGIGSIEEMQVAVAHARRGRADQHFPCAGFGYRNLLHFHGLVDFPKYCRLHDASPRV